MSPENQFAANMTAVELQLYTMYQTTRTNPHVYFHSRPHRTPTTVFTHNTNSLILLILSLQARCCRPILHRRQHLLQLCRVFRCGSSRCSLYLTHHHASLSRHLFCFKTCFSGWFLVRLSTRFDSVNCILLPLSSILIILCAISSGVCLRSGQLRYEALDVPPAFPALRKEARFLPGSILIMFGSVLHVLIIIGALRLKKIRK
jgi:hypothetical protein